jgi:hypothetical protein
VIVEIVNFFAASTIVTIGDGKFAKFWLSSWAQGQTLKIIAPTLFSKAKRKNITMLNAVQNNKWIDHISVQQQKFMSTYCSGIMSGDSSWMRVAKIA